MSILRLPLGLALTILAAAAFAEDGATSLGTPKFERGASSAESAPGSPVEPLLPGNVPKVGHSDLVPPSYDFWCRNCHTAANAVVDAVKDKSRVGILACGGQPQRDPGHHTANWIAYSDGNTCILNWGKSCCWEATAIPPDISHGKGRACAQWACGEQYSNDIRAEGATTSAEKANHCLPPEETRCLDPGQTVERANSWVCAWVEAGTNPNGTMPPGRSLDVSPNPMKLKACTDCCNSRARLFGAQRSVFTEARGWVTEHAFDADREKFNLACGQACKLLFAPLHEKRTDPDPVKAERVLNAVLRDKKLDIERLTKAAEGR